MIVAISLLIYGTKIKRRRDALLTSRPPEKAAIGFEFLLILYIPLAIDAQLARGKLVDG
jgi:hypothetical protein